MSRGPGQPGSGLLQHNANYSRQQLVCWYAGRLAGRTRPPVRTSWKSFTLYLQLPLESASLLHRSRRSVGHSSCGSLHCRGVGLFRCKVVIAELPISQCQPSRARRETESGTTPAPPLNRPQVLGRGTQGGTAAGHHSLPASLGCIANINPEPSTI